MQTTNQTRIEADPDLPLIRIIREFDAPRSKVWRAHVEPDLVAQWLGPRRYRVHIDQWDCRTGGSWRFVQTPVDPQHGEEPEHGFHGCFHDVRPEEVIVQTFTWEGFSEGVSLERLTLEDLDGGRTLLVATSLVESFESRDAMLSSGMGDGVREGYERLDELFASEA